jgi:hypothetical protein
MSTLAWTAKNNRRCRRRDKQIRQSAQPFQKILSDYHQAVHWRYNRCITGTPRTGIKLLKHSTAE